MKINSPPSCLRNEPWRGVVAFAMCLFAGLLTCGCALLSPRVDPTRFYVLAMPRAEVVRDVGMGIRRWNLGLKPVEIPMYLRTKSMVVRRGANELQFAEFDRWAEPLDQGILRMMKEALGDASNVRGVTSNTHGEDSLDYEVRIRILACEGVWGEGDTSAIHFAASWEVRAVGTNSPAIQPGGYRGGKLAWDGEDYGQLAERLSEAMVGASRALAASLPNENVPGREIPVEAAKP